MYKLQIANVLDFENFTQSAFVLYRLKIFLSHHLVKLNAVW